MKNNNISPIWLLIFVLASLFLFIGGCGFDMVKNKDKNFLKDNSPQTSFHITNQHR